MNNKTVHQPTPKKCYNSFSCIVSVLIIVFVIGSIIWDMTVSKPTIYNSIEEIKTEVKHINEKIDARYYVIPVDSSYAILPADSTRVINETTGLKTKPDGKRRRKKES